MNNPSFFDEQTEQSQVKAAIVAKYFDTWASIIINTQKRFPTMDQRIAYIDLFAGPGRYKDGSKSTPVLILEKAIRSTDFRERLVTMFNDQDPNHVDSLAKAIKEVPDIEALKYEPQVDCLSVDDEFAQEFEEIKLIPTLFFVDPWGYKGLSLRLVSSVLKDWGCDCLFFFNYTRINMGITNPTVKKHMVALLGEDRIDRLAPKLEDLTPKRREFVIIEELCQALKEYGGKFVLPFRFKGKDGKRTSHHLIFVSKGFKGYDAMKEVMAKESSSNTDGVPSFEYNPAHAMPQQTLLFKLSRPLEDLKEMLLEEYAGQKMSMLDIHNAHSIDTPYIKKNYKKALSELSDKGIIKAANRRGKRPRKGTFADDAVASFPKRRRQG